MVISNVKQPAQILRIAFTEPIEGKTQIVKATLSDKRIVIVPIDYTKGELGLFFKTGTFIGKDFLSKTNLFYDVSRNEEEVKGKFSPSGKVTKRAFGTGLKPAGFFLRLSVLEKIGITNFEEFKEGISFNRIHENTPFILSRRKSVKIKGALQTEETLAFHVESLKEYPVPWGHKSSIVADTLPVGPVIEILKKEQTFVKINGYKVGSCSLRLRTFIKSQTCVCCGAKAIYFRIQKFSHQEKSGWHLELYCQRPGGEVDFMTKDHIIPFAKRGPDTLDNMQTMCSTCNKQKGDSL